jgi:antitoxin component YwqK of YwqJK toxin-antitoxin module
MQEKELFYENGNLRYQGELFNDIPHGQGTFYDESGSIWYQGECKEGKRHGQGIFYYENGNIIYQGEWADNDFHGFGTFYFENGNIAYQGQWSNDKPHGQGISYYDNGNIDYEGEYSNGKPHGQGTSYYENGNIEYQGEWVEGGSHGQGTEYHESGNIKYQGEWADGNRHGQGISYYDNGNMEYEGELDKGEFLRGTQYYENGSKKYEGEWKYGKYYHGKGTLFYEDDTPRYSGIFELNEFTVPHVFRGLFLDVEGETEYYRYLDEINENMSFILSDLLSLITSDINSLEDGEHTLTYDFSTLGYEELNTSIEFEVSIKNGKITELDNVTEPEGYVDILNNQKIGQHLSSKIVESASDEIEYKSYNPQFIDADQFASDLFKKYNFSPKFFSLEEIENRRKFNKIPMRIIFRRDADFYPNLCILIDHILSNDTNQFKKEWNYMNSINRNAESRYNSDLSKQDFLREVITEVAGWINLINNVESNAFEETHKDKIDDLRKLSIDSFK